MRFSIINKASVKAVAQKLCLLALVLELPTCTALAQAPTLYTYIQPFAPSSKNEIFLHFNIMDPCNMDIRVTSITRKEDIITVVVDQQYVGPNLPEGSYCLSPPPDGVFRVSLGVLPAGNYVARVDHWHPAYDQAVAFSVAQGPLPVSVDRWASGLLALLVLVAAASSSARRRKWQT